MPNQTEQAAYLWLQTQGYGPEEIRYARRGSPDFRTADGKCWEVKLARNWQVVFTAVQEDELEPDCTILIFDSADDESPAASVPFGELSVPGKWKRYHFASVDVKLYVPSPQLRRRIRRVSEKRGQTVAQFLEMLLDEYEGKGD